MKYAYIIPMFLSCIVLNLRCSADKSIVHFVQLSESGDNFCANWTLNKWKEVLPIEVYRVARLGKTEAAYSSSLLEEKRKGIYGCVCCGKVLFRSETKFDSNTGWPSFFEAEKNAVQLCEDHRLAEARTEVECSNCHAHLGHLFVDGPLPTGKRYCINGITLQFNKNAN